MKNIMLLYFVEHNFGVIITDDLIEDNRLNIDYIKIDLEERPDTFIIIGKILNYLIKSHIDKQS